MADANAPIDLGRKRFQFSSDLVDLKNELAVFTARQSAGAHTKFRCLAAEMRRIEL
jgi:hypothetical protein